MKLNLIKNQQKFLSKILVFKPLKFAYFVVDQFLFLITLSLFLYSIIKGNREPSWDNITVLALTSYLLLKFIIVNWFGLNTYFKYIRVFNYNLKVDKNKVKIYRNVDYAPLWYISLRIFSIIAVAIICMYETQNLVNSKNILNATITICLNLLLIPSFINTFNTIISDKKGIENNYTKLVKDQYYSNESLFENIEWSERQLNLNCKNVDLVSKNGVFVTLSFDDLNSKEAKDVQEINQKILERYKEIWKVYYELLRERFKNKFSRTASKKLYWIERIYDHIFLDFYAI
ncbi:hypothetical protein SGLAD_v1c05270 [Spiroplasma gladiatoris]|uniref:Uncharacterized protein n=1 Tax=Spiroplasma gladiatoris TaxID=2143 RepID=A0A4P7AJ89_9MOLU|nr:hypothetical protein [Spiroplasma gladiatoris]QBQ07726.1 hypothetical protein SGLAD_v1c05270 [Spiroplasma gladiatoris]